MRTVVGFSLILATALGCKAKGPPGPPLEATISVSGNGKPGERATRIHVAFSRPMAAATDRLTLGLSPAVPGTTRWLDDRTLAFVPAAPLPRSTRFRVTVPAGTRALDGAVVARAIEHAFETERLELKVNPKAAPDSPDARRWAVPTQQIAMVFNQAVRAEAVAERCAFTADGKRVAATLIDATSGETRERLVVGPAEPLALSTRWTFRCDDRLTGAEGALGMRPFGGDGGTPDQATLAFDTYGAFRIAQVSPTGRAVDPDQESLEIQFSNPVRSREALPISVIPPIEGFAEHARPWREQLSVSLRGLQPNTEYTIKLAAGVKDIFGQTLPALSHTFRTGDASPRLDMQTGNWVVEAERGNFPLWTRNLQTIDVRAAQLGEAKLLELVGALDWWDDTVADLDALKIKYVDRQLKPPGRKNRWDQVALTPSELLGKGAAGAGFYYFAVSSPDVPRGKDEERPAVREVLVNLTNLGVTAKLAGGSGLVWVTRLSDGAPQPGAEVIVRERGGKVRWRGRTGADGTVSTPGRGALLPPPAAPPTGQQEGEGEGEGEGGMGEGQTPRLLVFARLGPDLTFVDPDRSGALEGWQFSVPTQVAQHREQLRGFAHTDRGLYRPGDTVHLKGLVRTMRLGQGLALPGKRKVEVTVRDPRGETTFTKSVALSRFGGFAVDVALTADARLGDYVMEARLPGGAFRERFAVEEYRAATFEVKVKPTAPSAFVGDKVRLAVDARYLYGAPVGKGTVKWRVSSRMKHIAFGDHPSYQFTDGRLDADGGHSGGEEFFAEDSGTLDAKGRSTVAFPVARDAFLHSRDLLVSADVQDESNQGITASAVVPVHRSRLYLGLEREGTLVAAGKSTTVRAVAVDPAGKRVSAVAKLTVRKRTWSCAWERWGYSGSYRCDKKETDILTRSLEISADRPAEGSFVVPDGGEYWVSLDGKDAVGSAVSAATSLWAWGNGQTPWRVDEGSRFELVADRASYQVGDTARLLLKTPTAGATALMTIEREGVLEKRLVELAGGQSLELPILPSYGPNVFVSVVLARGRSAPGARGLPSVRMGLVTLAVDSKAKRLQVAVTTDREHYRPGDKVTAQIQLTDAGGHPVAGEVALAAADEGVLSLIAFATPDPIATFYAPWALGVRTTTQYERLARLPEPGQERYATGGDGPGKLGTMRSRFLATAYWNPRIETDAAGRAQVSFAAPDNLTAFRLMAVAADAGDRFGSGERRFSVRKPLQMLGALPRFLSVGDQASGGVLLVNETGKPGTATVEVRVTGARLVGPAKKTVELAAGARAAVGFPVVGEKPGEARFRFAATLGEERDGIELVVPVSYPTAPETTLVASGETERSAELPLVLPAGVLPGSAVIELSVDPDGLAGIEEGLRDLIAYPHGCLEQTTSRLIPLVAVEELARALGLPELDGPKLQRYIRVAVEKIGKHQTESGGFSLWPGARPEPYLTAYALWGLKLSEDAGHPVDRRRIDEGVAYLRRSLGAPADAQRPVHDELGELGSRAFALHVLSLLGKPEAGFAAKLLEQRARLPRFGQAFLAQALAGPLGAGHAQVVGLLDDLMKSADRQPQLALIRERPGSDLGYYMSSDTRTSAIATDAFLYLRPTEPEIPRLVRGLLAQRRDGAWMSTQENLYALVTLVHYLKLRPPTPVSVRATWGNEVLLQGQLAAQGTGRIRRATLAMPAGTLGAPLRIEASGGRAHYQVRLRFRRDKEHQPPVEAGFGLRREYLDPASNQPVAAVKAGDMLRVRITVSVPEDRNRVAITDFLPAGLEAVNSRFATSGEVVPRSGRAEPEQGYWIVHRELRDDRVSVFADRLWQGSYGFDYLARATTLGTFVAPGATVSEMYQPQVRARTAIASVTVRAK